MKRPDRIFVYGNAMLRGTEHHRLGTVVLQGAGFITDETALMIDLGYGPLLASVQPPVGKPCHGEVFLITSRSMETLDEAMRVGDVTHRRRVSVKITNGPHKGKRWRPWTYVARDTEALRGKPVIYDGSWRAQVRRALQQTA